MEPETTSGMQVFIDGSEVTNAVTVVGGSYTLDPSITIKSGTSVTFEYPEGGSVLPSGVAHGSGYWDSSSFGAISGTFSGTFTTGPSLTDLLRQSIIDRCIGKAIIDAYAQTLAERRRYARGGVVRPETAFERLRRGLVTFPSDAP